MDALKLLTGGFEEWLLDRTGPNSGSRLKHGVKLDVFATSMRTSKPISAHLKELAKGEALGYSDSTQRITDLNQTGLVKRTGSGKGELTAFGKRVLGEWEQLDVANNKEQDEIVRQVVLVHAGTAAHRADYLKAYSFWQEMRRLHTATEWYAAPIALYMVSYLNATVNGFNPWKTIYASKADVVTVSIERWSRWADETCTPNGWCKTAGRKLLDSASSAAQRSMGRVAFCMALEALRLADDGKTLTADLSDWSRLRLPDGSPLKVQIGDRQIDKIGGFLRDRRPPLDPAAAEALRLLKSRRNVILYGPPGTGKSRAAVQIQKRWAAENSADSVLLTTFHPSYSYEDFVEGWRPDPEAAGGFKLAHGVLLEAIERTRKDPTLLIIDEINRGDVARIFGEFVTFIEHDKRGIEFTTAQNPQQRHRIPKNLFLLGTMNTADKSINLLDTALRRRFTFVQCPPDPEVFDRSPGLIGAIDGLRLKELLTTINQRLSDHQVETDRQIGHGMLCIPVDSSDPVQELLDRLCYSILAACG